MTRLPRGGSLQGDRPGPVGQEPPARALYSPVSLGVDLTGRAGLGLGSRGGLAFCDAGRAARVTLWRLVAGAADGDGWRGALRSAARARAEAPVATRRSGAPVRVGVSQYGQIAQRGSIGFPHASQGSLTRARHDGQRR